MVTHFSYDITHFDQQVLYLMKDLHSNRAFIQRIHGWPGVPVTCTRSNVCVHIGHLLLLFFSFFSPNTNFNISDPAEMTGTERLERIDRIEKKLKKNKDGEADSVIRRKLDKLAAMRDTTKPVGRADYEQFGLNQVRNKYQRQQSFV